MNIYRFLRAAPATGLLFSLFGMECLSLQATPATTPIAAKSASPALKAPQKPAFKANSPKAGNISGVPAVQTPAVQTPAVQTPVPLPYVPPLAAPVLETVSTRLANGLTLVTNVDRLAPRVALSLLIKAGAADETPDTAGWRRLLADAMLRSSKSAAGEEKSASDVQRVSEELGGRSGATVSDDSIEFWAIGNSARQSELLDLVLQMALRPRLSDTDIDVSRDRLAARQDAESENVPAQAVNALRGQLYRNSENVPIAYGLPGTGSEGSLKTLSAARLRQLHARFFQPAQMTLAAAGDVDTATLRTRLEQLARTETAGEGDALLPFPGNSPRLVPPSKDAPPLIVRQLPLRDPVPASWLFVGFAGPGAGSADLPALRVLSAALGEMPRSRLEKRLLSSSLIPGLDAPSVFQAAAQWTPRRYAGELVVFAQTKAEDVEEIKNALLDEINKIREGSLSTPELERAKNFARGGWAVERETLRDRAYQTAFALMSGASDDVKWPSRVAAVTSADVRRVAQKYLQNYAVTLVMPED